VCQQVAKLGGGVPYAREPAEAEDQEDTTRGEDPRGFGDPSLGIHVVEHHRHGHGVERMVGESRCLRRHGGEPQPAARCRQNRRIRVDADDEAVLARDERQNVPSPQPTSRTRSADLGMRLAINGK
jgi:hypothetical protein